MTIPPRLTPAEIVQRAADLLVPGLRHLVEGVQPRPGVTWEQFYAARDTRDGRAPRKRSLDDPRFLLNIVTYEWKAFGRRITPMHSAWARELTTTLNRAAHDRHGFSEAETWRFLDTLAHFCDNLLPDADLIPAICALRTTYEQTGATAASALDVRATPPPSADEPAAQRVSPAPPPSTTLTPASRSDEADVDNPSTPRTEDAPDPVRSLCEDVDDSEGLGNGRRRLILRTNTVAIEIIYTASLGFAQVYQGGHPIVEITCANLTRRDIRIDPLTVHIDGLALDAGVGQLPSLDLPADVWSTFTRNQIEWTVEPRAFAEVTESTDVALAVRCTVAGRTLDTAGDITVLARDEWSAEPHPEMISAFVAPTDPGVREIVEGAAHRTKASSDLAPSTGDAIYAELASRGLRYLPVDATTPAIRVRRPEQTLAQGGGTSLDLAVLYASALEAAGISPVITLTQDGALGGYLTSDLALPEPALTDSHLIHTLARSQYLVPVDLSVFDQGPDVPRSEATAATARYWERDLGRVTAVIDVAAARRRVRPLPRLTTDSNGLLVMYVEQPAPLPLQLDGSADAGTTTTPSAHYPRRVDNWRSALLDLSFRNPLLKLKSSSGVALHVPERSLPSFEDLLASGASLTVRHGLGLDPLRHGGKSSVRERDEASIQSILIQERLVHGLMTQDALGTRLDRVRRQAQRVIEETGSNSLFVTIGALKWQDAQGKDAYAPLYLLPVKLQGRTRGTYKISREGDEVALPNYCLIHKLKVDHDLEIPELEIPPHDDAGIDVPRTLTAIRQAIIAQGLPFAVVSDVRLAILQFSTLAMWRDVSGHWRTLTRNPVVKHLIETPHDAFDDPVPQPELTELAEAEEYLPLPADGSQVQAVRWARAGRTFVLEGPPGTGKSQTITNIIASCLAHGQSVLFVAEKPAALDVVRRRLADTGFGPLTLNLHGNNLTLTSVRSQLRNAWESTPRDDLRFEQARSKARSLIEELAAYPRALHDVGPAGYSLWTAHNAVLQHISTERANTAIPAPLLRGDVRIEDALNEIGRAEERISVLAQPLTHSPWGLAGPEAAPIDVTEVASALAAVEGTATRLSAPLTDLLRATGPSDWSQLTQLLAELGALPGELAAHAGRRAPGAATQLHLLAADLDAFVTEHHPLISRITPAAQRAPVPQLREDLNAAHAASLLKRKRLVANAEANITALIRPDGDRPHDLRAFLNELELFQAEADVLRRRSETLLPGGGDPHLGGDRARQLARYLDQHRNVEVSLNGPQALETYLQCVVAQLSDPRHDVETLEAFTRAWRNLTRILAVHGDTVATWLRGRGLSSAILDTLPAWLDAARGHRFGELMRVVDARTALADLRRMGLEDLSSQLERGDLGGTNLRDAVAADVADAVRGERLDSTGLDRFDADRRSRRVEEFARALRNSRACAPTALPALVRAAHDVDTRRPSRALAGLHREFERKRGGSIRELVTQHSEALRQLTPCLLMSPANVARFIPADVEPFDLVIFDEASQIRVADAVGALGRARAAVIVGDSQQMPPTSMFATSLTDEDADASIGEDILVPPDQESILRECVDSNLPRLWLTWHYRSRDESLISFSNQAYYDSRLASFPGPPADVEHRAISMEFVGGRFDGGRDGSRTNKAEAAAVLQHIKRLLHNDPTTSIGVVTLNSPQRDLLTAMLEEDADDVLRHAMGRDDGNALFVKNLENVQGDERDVILFSLAFSPDETTNRLSLNFGPLSQTGGQHRLNVAITRARQTVKVFASFRPEDIDLGRTRSIGLRDLRAYLEFARGDETAVARTSTRLAPDAHRRRLYEVLTESGLEVREGIGASSFKVDLAVRQPGSDAWVALLLDGQEWADRTTVSDRDVLPDMVLGSLMKWPHVEHIWLPEWIADEDAVARRIHRACTDVAATQPPPSDAPAHSVDLAPMGHPVEHLDAGVPKAGEENSTPVMPNVDDADAPTLPIGDGVLAGGSTAGEGMDSTAPAGDCIDGGASAGDCIDGALSTADEILLQEFVPWASGPMEHVRLSDLSAPHIRAQLRDTADDIIAVEGPVESRRLAGLIGRAYGINRMSTQWHSTVRNLIPRAQVNAEHGLTFVWPKDTRPETYTMVRPSSVPHRSLTEISGAELTNAMILALSESPVMSVAALHRTTALTFGIREADAEAKSHFDNVLEWAVRNGWIVQDGPICALPKR